MCESLIKRLKGSCALIMNTESLCTLAAGNAVQHKNKGSICTVRAKFKGNHEVLPSETTEAAGLDSTRQYKNMSGIISSNRGSSDLRHDSNEGSLAYIAGLAAHVGPCDDQGTGALCGQVCVVGYHRAI